MGVSIRQKNLIEVLNLRQQRIIKMISAQIDDCTKLKIKQTPSQLQKFRKKLQQSVEKHTQLEQMLDNLIQQTEQHIQFNFAMQNNGQLLIEATLQQQIYMGTIQISNTHVKTLQEAFINQNFTIQTKNDDMLLLKSQGMLYQFIKKKNQNFIEQEITKIQWSQSLKSKSIQIYKSEASIQYYTSEFCLLNLTFSNTLKSKQYWAFRIHIIKQSIGLGICLMSKMKKYNYSIKNQNILSTGHGLYMITDSGLCRSHSHQEFNGKITSFSFNNDDQIQCQYDPVQWKLKFLKNKVEKFEMQIIAPSSEDCYCPCIQLSKEGESIELIKIRK